MSTSFDAFGGASTELLGAETGEGVVYSVLLKRVRYGSSDSHLQWQSQKVRILQAGNVEKLVEHLAPWRDPVDVSFRTCFLCTYRTFTSPDVVLRLLIDRFQQMEPSSSDCSKDAADKATVQNHVISYIRYWLESYPLDFHRPPSYPLLSQLHTLTTSSPLLQRTVDNLLLEFETRDYMVRGQCGASVDSGLGVACEDGEPGEECDGCDEARVDFDLCTLNPKQFAQSLTAEDAELFQHVSPPHCLDYIREPKNTGNAPTVRACIQHFNQVSLIVIATIFKGETPEQRGAQIARWIDIASECRGIKNFSSLTAIISGLQSLSVYRLRRSWDNVQSCKLSLFQELSSLLTADGNHQMSRNLLNREGTAKYAELSPRKSSKDVHNGMVGSIQGVVPYLGIFLTDLTMLQTAHKDLTETGLVNFDKRRKQFELLAQLTLYQKSAANYHFPSHQGLLGWMNSVQTLSQRQSYQLSKDLEPDDSPANLTPNTVQKAHLSPARFRSKLKCLFNGKVGDSHTPTPSHHTPSLLSPPPHSSHVNKKLSDATSYEHLDRLDSVVEATGVKFRKRSNSLSPSLARKFGQNHLKEIRPQPLPGHVIRVAMTHSDHCNYKCLLVTESDRAKAVIQRALGKFSVEGSSSEYSLVQVIDKRTVEIPADGNVYYALQGTSETENAIRATLLLAKKSPV